MDFTIAGILMLDGVTNGAIYALLGLAIVLVFAITRVIFHDVDDSISEITSQYSKTASGVRAT